MSSTVSHRRAVPKGIVRYPILHVNLLFINNYTNHYFQGIKLTRKYTPQKTYVL